MANSKKTEIEQFVINRVKEIRIDKGLSQEDLASFLDKSRGFIGQVESHNHPTKYNLNHLNILAFELGVSLKDFMPAKPILVVEEKEVKKTNK